MRIVTLIMSILLAQGIMSSAYAQIRIDGDWNSPKCVEVIWERTNLTEKEKQFDIDHDIGIKGRRFSCRGEITASEVNKAFLTVKTAIASDDRETVADNSIYPFDYWVETEEPTEYGYIQPKEAKTKEEFIRKYDEIISEKARQMFECTTINEIETRSMGTITIAQGYIFFNKHPDNNKDIVRNFHKYPMRLGSIGPFMPRHADWVKKYCE